MTEALGIKLKTVPKESTLWKCPYCSACIFFIPSKKRRTESEDLKGVPAVKL
jgi:hypothetical protein